MAVTAASRPFQVAFAVWLWLCLTWGASGLLKEEAHTVSIPPAPAVGLSIGSGRPSVGTEFCLRNHVGVDIVDTAAVIKDEFDWDNDMRYRPEKNFVHLTIPSKKQECRHMENYRFANGWPWTLTMFFRGGGKATLTVDQNDAVRGRVKRLEIHSDVPDLIAMQTVDTSDERLVIDLFSERDGPGLAAGQVNSTILNGKGSGQGSRRAAFLPRSSP